MATKFLVIVEGGIVQDLLANDGTLPDWVPFDWDDFKDDSITYWNNMGAEWQETFKAAAPKLCAYALDTIKEQQEQDAEAERSIPFHDVPDLSRNQRQEN